MKGLHQTHVNGVCDLYNLSYRIVNIYLIHSIQHYFSVIRFVAEKKIKVDDSLNELESIYELKRSKIIARHEKELENLEVLVTAITEFMI